MKRLVSIILVFMLAAFAAQAQQEQEEEAEAEAAPAEQMFEAEYAAVRIAHLVRDGDDFTVMLNGESWADEIGAGSVTTYKLVRAGEYQLEIVADDAEMAEPREEEQEEPEEAEEAEEEPVEEEEPAEEEPAEEEPAEEEPAEEEQENDRRTIASESLSLEAGAYYTVVVSGTVLDEEAIEEVREEEPVEVEDEEVEEEEPVAEEEPAVEEEEVEVAEDEAALRVTVEPQEATVHVAGPDGFEDTFTGSATLTGIPAGEYAVQATHEGYQPAEDTIQVEEGEIAEVTLRLEPDNEVEEPEEEVEEEPEDVEPTDEEVDADERYQVQIHVIQDDVQVPPAGMALVRIIHGGAEVPAVDVIALRDPEVDPEDPNEVEEEPVEDPNEVEEEPVEDPNEVEEEPVEDPNDVNDVEAQEIPQEVREAVDEAHRAVHEEDDAEAALDDAISTTEQHLGEAEGELQTRLVEIHEALQEANRAVRVDDMEAARNALDEAQRLAEEGVEARPEQEEEVDPNDEEVDEAEEVEAEEVEAEEVEAVAEDARLDITVEPQGASVTVTGPDDYEEQFTGSRTLEGLMPGTYFVDATMEHHAPDGVELELEEGAEEEVSLTLERLDEAGPPPVEGENIMPGLAYGTTSEYVALPADTYTLQGQEADTDEPRVYFELSEISLEPGVIYTFFAYGGPGADEVSIAVTVDGIFGQELEVEPDEEEDPDEEPAEEEVDEEEEELEEEAEDENAA